MKMKRVLYSVLGLLIIFFIGGCTHSGEKESVYYVKERAKMIEYLNAAGIHDPALIKAMNAVHREEFVPYPKEAYKDRSFKLGAWAVAASPLVIAMRLDALNVKPGEKVLEIGTETGYEAAVMREMGADVYSIEILPELAEAAKARLEKWGYKDIHLRTGDGFYGWEEAAPFDAIIFACTPDDFPPRLVQQLKEDGRMVLSLGKLYGTQTLVFAWKEKGKMQTRPLSEIKASPMRGKITE